MTSNVVLAGEIGIDGPGGFRPVHGRQPSLVLAYLTLERHRAVQREELAELLWPEHLPEHWAGAVRGVIAKLRDAIGDDDLVRIETTRGSVQLVLGPECTVDVEDAARAVDVADDLARASRWDDAAAAALDALAVLRRPVLAREDNQWLWLHRQRLSDLWRRALLIAASSRRATADLESALALVDELLDHDGLDEGAVRLAMSIHADAGRRAAALATYEQLRSRLDDELGVRPSKQTEQLWMSLLGDAPVPRAGSRASRSPVDRATRFVGRLRELTMLDEVAERARRDGLQLVAVTGEAGIGKSRLLAEWVEQQPDATILWGRCSGARLAFEPIVEAIGRRLVDLPSAVERLGRFAGVLATVVPEIFGVPDVPSVEPDYVRATLFRALSAAIADAAVDHLAVLVIDDLQDADSDTMELLQFLIEAIADEPIVIAMSVKEADQGVLAVLAELQRRGLERVGLTGLTEDEVQGLLTSTGVSTEHATAIAASLRERTAGNPLYVHQVVGDATASGRPIDPYAVPATVRDLLALRVASLSQAAAETLQVAAAAGEGISFDALVDCSVRERDEVLAIVEELCHRGFLAEVRGGELAWMHALVRDAVSVTTTPTRAAALHLRLALAFEGRQPPAVVAHHFRLAGRPGRSGAIVHGLLAGAVALDQSAWATAARELEAVISVAPGSDDHAAALIGLGHAERGRREPARARRCFDEALALARDARLPRRVAEAVLGMIGGGGRGVGIELADVDRAALLREALAGLGAANHDLAVPLLAELSLALVLTPNTIEERIALVDEALRRARTTTDSSLTAVALIGRRTTLVDATSAVQRLQDADEVLAMKGGSVRPELVLAAHLARVEDLLLLGRTREAERSLLEARAAATAYDHPYWLWAVTTWEALLGVIDGRLDDAEALAFVALGHQPTNPEALAALGVELVDIRLFQGRADEVVELLASAADENPHIPAYRAVLALCAAESGDTDRARAAFEHFAAESFENVPADSNRFLALAVLADTCATLGDRERAGALFRLLEPYAGLQVVLNCYGGGGAFWGPTTMHLARLARLAGDDAVAAALTDHARLATTEAEAPLVAQRIDALLGPVTDFVALPSAADVSATKV